MLGDPYVVLGVSHGASAKDIRAAYLRLARQYHPDVNPGDQHAEERLKTINGAYDLLTDPVKKSDFDKAWARAEEASRESKNQASHKAPPRNQKAQSKASPPPPPPPQAAPAPGRWRLRGRWLISPVLLIALIRGLSELSGSTDDVLTPTAPPPRATATSTTTNPTIRTVIARPRSRVPTAVVASMPEPTPLPCIGWGSWFATAGRLDGELSDINDEIDTKTSPTEADFLRWANAVAEQRNTLKAMNPPVEAQELHRSKMVLRLLQENWLFALANGIYEYSPDRYERFVERLEESREMTEQVNANCTPSAPTAPTSSSGDPPTKRDAT